MNVYDNPTGPNADCRHKIADHQHGTHVCYVHDRCRCQPCRQANIDYERHRRQWLGEFPRLPEPYVDADQARKLVAELKQRGMGLKTIADRSGVAHGTLWKLVYGRPESGPTKRCRPETVERLQTLLDGLVWEEVTLADGAKVPGKEAQLIIRELVARGWTKAEIGRRVHGPTAKSLQVRKGSVYVSTLRTLRQLLCEPVPLRYHNPTGGWYQPTGRNPRPVPRLVDGVGGPVYEQASSEERLLDVLEADGGWLTYSALADRLGLTANALSSMVGRIASVERRTTVDGRTELRARG